MRVLEGFCADFNVVREGRRILRVWRADDIENELSQFGPGSRTGRTLDEKGATSRVIGS